MDSNSNPSEQETIEIIGKLPIFYCIENYNQVTMIEGDMEFNQQFQDIKGNINNYIAIDIIGKQIFKEY